MIQLQKIIIPLTIILALSGCANKQGIYYWGNYEPQLYEMYSKPEKFSNEAQIIKLEEDIEKARSVNKPLPPGFNAHLGYLYFGAGNLDKAVTQFEIEKNNYPESAQYMNSVIKRLKGGK